MLVLNRVISVFKYGTYDILRIFQESFCDLRFNDVSYIKAVGDL